MLIFIIFFLFPVRYFVVAIRRRRFRLSDAFVTSLSTRKPVEMFFKPATVLGLLIFYVKKKNYKTFSWDRYVTYSFLPPGRLEFMRIFARPEGLPWRTSTWLVLVNRIFAQPLQTRGLECGFIFGVTKNKNKKKNDILELRDRLPITYLHSGHNTPVGSGISSFQGVRAPLPSI